MDNFEYDASKSLSNFKKHGIDFIAAQKLWDDPNLLEIKAKTGNEERFILIGTIENKHYSAVVAYRDRYIRIISVRRSRKQEVALYES